MSRRTPGQEQPDTLRITGNLATTYKEQNITLKEEKDVKEKVLEVRKCTLGKGIPGYLTIELDGRSSEIKELEEKVCSARRG
ncbi:hypothetical protein BZA77DRAFT_353469 [Pyronema omphalodes]|nr:hypothetical protein BZA77DRAFT_353469 [Pyronema omphalodes]